MKKIISIILLSFILFSCKDKLPKGKFEVSGEIKNIPNQKIYLEHLFFSQKNPEILDSVELTNGKFKLTATAPEEGLFRLRMEKVASGFIFINDKPLINFNADINEVSLQGPTFNSPANALLKSLIVGLDTKGNAVSASSLKLDSLKTGDSTYTLETARRDSLHNQYKNFIINFIDTVSDPVVAMFALGYTQGIDPQALAKAIPGLSSRFPNHQGVTEIVGQYHAYIVKLNEPKPEKVSRPGIGNIAPDITMNDTEDKPFSLSQLKGKYVLVDFWASWCGPCRGENPNVVAAYNKYKNKNFTILGVSLDDNKQKWLNAIKADNLEWKQISDLKQWNSAAVGLYGFDGIPYNVLIDPSGKIIATELRGEDLDRKLAEVIR